MLESVMECIVELYWGELCIVKQEWPYPLIIME
jgi:hypothetical protein